MFIGFRGILDKNNLYSERGSSSSDQLRVTLEIARKGHSEKNPICQQSIAP
jgi:hypothetical protein